MSLNINNLAQTAASGVSALYPPTTLEGDKSTITGFLEGVGVESFTYDEGKNYARLTVYKEIEGTENKRSYNCIINNFFTSEERINLNAKFLLDTFLAVQPDADLTKAGNIESLEDLVTEFNKVFTLPSPMVEDVHAKIVFRDAEGDKSKYNLSKNFPVLEKKSTGKMKFKTNSKDSKYDDVVVFNKVAPQTDGELGGNTNNDFSLSPNPSFDGATSNL